MGHSTVVKSLRGKLEPALFFLIPRSPEKGRDTNARVHTSRNSETRKSKLSISGTSLCHTSWQHRELGSHCHPRVGRDAPEAKQVFGLQRQTGQDQPLDFPAGEWREQIVVHHGGPSFPHCLWNRSWHPPRYQCRTILFLKVLGGGGGLKIIFTS